MPPPPSAARCSIWLPPTACSSPVCTCISQGLRTWFGGARAIIWSPPPGSRSYRKEGSFDLDASGGDDDAPPLDLAFDVVGELGRRIANRQGTLRGELVLDVVGLQRLRGCGVDLGDDRRWRGNRRNQAIPIVGFHLRHAELRRGGHRRQARKARLAADRQ